MLTYVPFLLASIIDRALFAAKFGLGPVPLPGVFMVNLPSFIDEPIETSLSITTSPLTCRVA